MKNLPIIPDHRESLPIVSVSGGKDSTAVYCLATTFYGKNFIALFADTGHEHPVTVNYVKNLHNMIAGPEATIVKADFSNQLKKKGIKPTGRGMLDLALWKGRFPSTKAQFCTEWLKLWPMKLYLFKNFPTSQYNYNMITGIRRGESAKRSLRQEFEWNGYFDCLSINPLIHLSEKDVYDLLDFYQVPPNPLYSTGNNRVGCYPCIHAVKTQLEKMEAWAWDRLKNYEAITGRSWFPPKLTGEKRTHIPSIDEVHDWAMTSRGGYQFNMFKTEPTEEVASCMSQWSNCNE